MQHFPHLKRILWWWEAEIFFSFKIKQASTSNKEIFKAMKKSEKRKKEKKIQRKNCKTRLVVVVGPHCSLSSDACPIQRRNFNIFSSTLRPLRWKTKALSTLSLSSHELSLSSQRNSLTIVVSAMCFAFVWMGLFIHGSAAPTAIARELEKKIRSFSTPTFEQPRAHGHEKRGFFSPLLFELHDISPPPLKYLHHDDSVSTTQRADRREWQYMSYTHSKKSQTWRRKRNFWIIKRNHFFRRKSSMVGSFMKFYFSS